jgi:hypothetical protein
VCGQFQSSLEPSISDIVVSTTRLAILRGPLCQLVGCDYAAWVPLQQDRVIAPPHACGRDAAVVTSLGAGCGRIMSKES